MAAGDWLSAAASTGGEGTTKKNAARHRSSGAASAGWLSGKLGVPVDDDDDGVQNQTSESDREYVSPGVELRLEEK